MMKKLGMLLFLLCVLPIYASAEITIDATYGTDGKVKMEEPVRVDVVITNDAEPFQGSLLTTFKESYQLQSAQVYPVQLASGEQMELSFFTENYQGAMYGNESASFVLYDGDLRDGRVVEQVKLTENKPAIFNYETFVVGTYHADAAYSSLQQLRALVDNELMVEKLTAVHQDARDYALFDVLVMGDELLSFTQQEQLALVQWMKDGGRLVTDTALTGTSFEPYAALTFTNGTSSVATTELQELAEGGTFAAALTVKNATMQKGAVASPQQGALLAAARTIGSGQLIQTAFALNDAGLLQTNGYSHLFAQVMDLHAAVWKDYPQSSHAQIANNLTETNELFASFAFSIWKVVTVLAVYIILVSIVLYIILKKKDKREHAWWLIPAISIVFSIGLFIVGAKDRLAKPQLQEMMLWTVTETGGTQYFTQSVLANKAGDYTFALNEDVTAATYHMSGVANDNKQLSYRDGNELVVKGIPYWGVKSIVGSVQTTDGFIEQQLTVQANVLKGTLTNHFPFALEQVQAWMGREFYAIGDIPAGETIDVNVPIKYSYLMKAMLEEGMLYAQRDGELAELRRNSLLSLASNILNDTEAPLLVAAAPEATLPAQLEQGAKKNTDVLIATPLTAMMNYKGEVTLTMENLQLELIQHENYSDWLTADTTEWYFERMPYTLKYHVPKTLADVAIAWQALTVQNTDNRLQLQVLNRDTNKYEALGTQTAQTYVKDGYVQLELLFVGDEMGNMADLPKIELKGVVK